MLSARFNGLNKKIAPICKLRFLDTISIYNRIPWYSSGILRQKSSWYQLHDVFFILVLAWLPARASGCGFDGRKAALDGGDVMAPFLPVNDRRQYGKINKHRAIEKRYYIQWCMHVDMMFMFISWYWLRFHEYERILWKYDRIIFKFNFESHYIHIRICIYIHDFLWWDCHERNISLYIIWFYMYCT